MVSLPRGPRLLLLALAVLLAIYVARLTVGASWPAWTHNLYDAIEIGALIACGWRALTSRTERAAWWCMTAALASYTAADLYWRFAFEDLPADEIPYPSIDDALYLAFFPLATWRSSCSPAAAAGACRGCRGSTG